MLRVKVLAERTQLGAGRDQLLAPVAPVAVRLLKVRLAEKLVVAGVETGRMGEAVEGGEEYQ